MTITLTTAQSQSFLNTVTFISYVSTMNGHRDIQIRRPLTLQSHVIKMTTSQNHVNTKTNIAGLYDYLHHQSRRLMQHHHKVTWIPWPTLQNYVILQHVTSHMKTMNNSASLCDCYYRVVWMPSPPQQSYMPTTVTKVCGDHNILYRVIRLPHPTLSQLCEQHNIPEISEYHHQQHYKLMLTTSTKVITSTKVAKLCQYLSEIYDYHHHHHCRVMQIPHPWSQA